MTFKNMKIEITDEVQLKAVCDVLQSMGYKNVNLGWESPTGIVFIDNESKLFCTTVDHNDVASITLTDLLALRDKQFMGKIHAK